MEERINDKIGEIEGFVSDLAEMLPGSLEDYIANKEKRAACERYFEKIVEALTDLAFFIIKSNRMPNPKDDEGAFFILAQKGVITEELAKRLKQAKGMRNFISHEYGKVDDELVFEALSGELEKDTMEFLDAVREK